MPLRAAIVRMLLIEASLRIASRSSSVILSNSWMPIRPLKPVLRQRRQPTPL